MTLEAVEIVPAAAEHGAALIELFERDGSRCFCRWWHFAGDKNGWLDRLAHSPDVNRDELRAAFAAGSNESQGLIALAGDRAVGWMKLAPATAMKKLYEQRPYRTLPRFGGDRSGVLVIGCFLVDPEWRRRGVSRALVDAAIEHARTLGARAIEAFPRRAEPVSDELLWTGPPSVLFDAGFEVVDGPDTYPVLRRTLS